jgi:hypothetical protein
MKLKGIGILLSEIQGFHGITNFWVLRRLVWRKFTEISEVFSVSTIRALSFLKLEAVSTSETLVNFYQTT